VNTAKLRAANLSPAANLCRFAAFGVAIELKDRMVLSFLQAGASQNSQPPTPEGEIPSRRSNSYNHEREISEPDPWTLICHTSATNSCAARWLQVQAFEKKVHKHSSPEEYVKLAEVCLLEAERTLDREVADMLLLKAGRYLNEAKRAMATRREAH
jgi:hypothetical protein